MDPRLLILCAGAVACVDVATESPHLPCRVAYKGRQTSVTNLLISEEHIGSTVLDLSNACPWFGWRHVGSQVVACSDDPGVEVLFQNINKAAVVSSNDALNYINAIVSCEASLDDRNQTQIPDKNIVEQKS